jgi:dihydrofolate reductase
VANKNQMSKVFFDAGITLDGYLAGTNRGPENPLGDGGTSIHEWMYKQKAFWRSLGMEGGKEDGPDGKLIENVFARTGAYIMGKRMFEEGEVHWPEDLYKAPVYVLTHEKRDPWIQKGSTVFYFVNDGIESALARARENCNGKDIRIQGGADTIQQYLNAGFIDEYTIHIAPVVLGKGIRLFDNIDKSRFHAAPVQTSSSPMATHITFKVEHK